MRFHARPDARYRLLPGAILLAGLALRLFRLGADSLWYDETVSTALAGSPLPELIRHTAGDIHPPGYYLLLRGWLVLSGYPTGRADPTGNGLEFMAGFFSLFWGVALIALVYVLARRLVSKPAAHLAAMLAALSPYNVWYSQEVRMYTFGAGLGVLALYSLWRALYPPPSEHPEVTNTSRRATEHPERSSALLRATEHPERSSALLRAAQSKDVSWLWWTVYALAAAAGMYTLYYFAFLLIPLSLWALVILMQRRRPVSAWLVAHGAALLLYAPWLPIAWRQATQPPVPPWRTAPALLPALRESWTALSLGQSAPAWLWPILLMTLALYALGLYRLRGRAALPLCLATFGPLALILLISLATPLYHVRYLFTYSPAYYVVLAVGLAALGGGARQGIGANPRSAPDERIQTLHTRHPSVYPVRTAGSPQSVALPLAGLAAVWVVAAGVTLAEFWRNPTYRADDHRTAVRQLQDAWRPGDVALVNAGWAYTALTTYWDGPVVRVRLTDPLPQPSADSHTLVLVTTGHVDGDPGLGWADPQADFYALPAETARTQVAALFDRFPRLWHYRLYDTVNDPEGMLRGLLDEHGQLTQDEVYGGEAFLRVQRYASRQGDRWGEAQPSITLANGVELQWDALPDQVVSGDTLYPLVRWRATGPLTATFATSLRLIGPDGATWVQPSDEQPLGPLLLPMQWTPGIAYRQPLRLPLPVGTPPGRYEVRLVVYAPATGQPLPASEGTPVDSSGLLLGTVEVLRPVPAPPLREGPAQFGPVRLVEATSPAVTVSPGDSIPVNLLWQAVTAPGEPLVAVVQLLDAAGQVAAGLEEQPLQARYPTQDWAAGELVADRHALTVPTDLPAGDYRLIVGVYRAADGQRFSTRRGLLTRDTSWTIREIEVR